MFALSKDEDMPLMKFQHCNKLAYCHLVEEELDRNREYSSSALENDKRTLRRLVMSFFLNREVLYKKNHDMMLLRCIDVVKA
ncbi:hypothetical protein CR513_30293, partial [Mucuna pruriens]